MWRPLYLPFFVSGNVLKTEKLKPLCLGSIGVALPPYTYSSKSLKIIRDFT